MIDIGSNYGELIELLTTFEEIKYIVGIKINKSYQRIRIFEVRMLDYVSKTPLIPERYKIMLPLFGLRWCLILINFSHKEWPKWKDFKVKTTSAIFYSEALV